MRVQRQLIWEFKSNWIDMRVQRQLNWYESSKAIEQKVLPDASLKHNRLHLSLPTNLGSLILCSVSKLFKISFHCTSCVSFTWSSNTLFSSHSSCKSSFAGSVTGVNSPTESNTSAVDVRIWLFVAWFSCLILFQMWIMSLWKFHINPSTLIEFPDACSPFGAVFITSVDFDAHSWRFIDISTS